MYMQFKSRIEAGKQLAHALGKYRGSEVVVYGLPRGGIITAHEIAVSLQAPLDIIIVKKIGHPFSPEYALGTIDEYGNFTCNKDEEQEVDVQWLENEVEQKKKEVALRRKMYAPFVRAVSVKNKTAILVDDGVATGLTIKAGIRSLQHQDPKKIVVAVPVCPLEFKREMNKQGYELILLDAPEDYLGAVGAYYESFPQVSDEEVITILKNTLIPNLSHP